MEPPVGSQQSMDADDLVVYPLLAKSAEELWAGYVNGPLNERGVARMHFAFDTNHHVRRIRDELEPFVNSVHASLHTAHEERVEARAAIEAVLLALVTAPNQPPAPPISSTSPGDDGGNAHGAGVTPSLAGSPPGSGVVPTPAVGQGIYGAHIPAMGVASLLPRDALAHAMPVLTDRQDISQVRTFLRTAREWLVMLGIPTFDPRAVLVATRCLRGMASHEWTEDSPWLLSEAEAEFGKSGCGGRPNHLVYDDFMEWVKTYISPCDVATPFRGCYSH